MHCLSSTICAIFLLFALSGKLTFASVDNTTNERIYATKVFTHFLKVPWTNWDTSWINEVQSTCANDIATLHKSALAGEMWALQMLDAASKIPAGIITGNIRDLGMYDECIDVKPHQNSANIQGRHCMVSMSMPTKYVEDPEEALSLQILSSYNPTPGVAFNFAASLCLPSSCGVEDIAEFVEASIRDSPELTKLEIRVAQVTCSRSESKARVLSLGTILTISSFAVIIGFLVICTLCDFVIRVKSSDSSLTLQTLAKFSFYTNAIKLASTEIQPGTMPAVHGIRFIGMFMVVTAHRILGTMIKAAVNLDSVYKMKQSWMAPLILLLPFAVDTFLTIGAFLTSYLLLNALRSGKKFNLLDIYVHRYLRLTPPIAALILFDIFIVPHFGSGPIWEIVLGATSEFCRKNWWTNLLYVQNFVNTEQMCLPHTWYSAVEMQLFWISPIFLYALFYRPKIGLAMLTGISVVSLITPAVYLVLNQYSFLFDTHENFYEKYHDFIISYTPTYNRALPYFIGIFLGYYVANNDNKLTKVQASLNWILAGIFVFFSFWNTFFIQPLADVYNPAWEATYVSVGRLGWSLATAWLLYACTQGYGGPLGRFLSLPVFVPLSRISYSIYLVSVVLQVGVTSAEHTAEYLSPFTIMYTVWGDLALSTIIAFILTLSLETPIVVFEKILRAKGSSRNTKPDSMKKKDKLSAIIEASPNLSNDEGSWDGEIETRMSQLHFWTSASDVLNALGKKPTRTPAQWLQTWLDWKSGLLKDDHELKTTVKCIENVSAELETVKTKLEKELLIFLAVVNCSVDNFTKSTYSKNAEPTASVVSSTHL